MNISDMIIVLGDNLLSLDDLKSRKEISADEYIYYEKILGLKTVARFNELSHVELLMRIFHQLKSGELLSQNIKYVMISHTADQVFPTEYPSLNTILKEFNLPTTLILKSSGYNCATVFMHLILSNALLNTKNNNDVILLIILDIAFTPILKKIPGSTLLGDAAVAVTLSNNNKSHQYQLAKVHSYGEFAKGVWSNHGEQLLFQESYIRNLSAVIMDTVSEAGLTLSDIALILPHNVNKISWFQLCDALSISSDKIFMKNISKYGHCFGADPFINLHDAISDGDLKIGDYYLLVSVGLGASFAAALFKY